MVSSSREINQSTGSKLLTLPPLSCGVEPSKIDLEADRDAITKMVDVQTS
jgi:hypothetical protein